MSLPRRPVHQPERTSAPITDLLAYEPALPDPGRADRHRHTWDPAPATSARMRSVRDRSHRSHAA